jgi:hypothetical protein
MHFYFTLLIKHKVHKNLTQNSKHTSHLEANLLHKITCLNVTTLYQNLEVNITLKLHKILQKSELKARQKHTYSWSESWHETTSQEIGLQGQDYYKKKFTKT